MENEVETKKINRKPIIALMCLVVVGIIGGTFAYFSDSVTLKNIFKTATYKTVVTEEFVSPEDWLPGTTTSKTIIATNSGDIDVAVRVSYTESWTASDGSTLDGSITVDTKTEKAAIINFADNYSTKWTKSGDYYYYSTRLKSNESTTSLIKSVTFNENVGADTTCTTTTNGNTQTITCGSTGYVGATYNLTIKVETVQYDQYKDAWSTDVSIS